GDVTGVHDRGQQRDCGGRGGWPDTSLSAFTPVLAAAAAAGENNQSDRRPDRAWIGKLVNGRRNFRGRTDALYPNGIDQDFDPAGATPQDVENVADRSTARGSDNADTFWEFW